MKLDSDDTIRHIATEAKVRETKPPRQVLWAVASLSGGSEPSILAAEHSTEGATIWRVVALTPELVISVEAGAPVDPWEFDPEATANPDGMELDAYAYPRSAVTRLQLMNVRHAGPRPESHDTWSTQWVIHFSQGAPVAVPPGRRAEGDPGERIAMELLSGLR